MNAVVLFEGSKGRGEGGRGLGKEIISKKGQGGKGGEEQSAYASEQKNWFFQEKQEADGRARKKKTKVRGGGEKKRAKGAGKERTGLMPFEKDAALGVRRGGGAKANKKTNGKNWARGGPGKVGGLGQGGDKREK